ncbi:unnamed protein product [Bursaphelenchus xylophilus]|nr:unnamed protein product [Bursaphelenchus xylophilus]CAG9080987.1 unnamed protein product [Bursaphelenchus xylophilus]
MSINRAQGQTLNIVGLYLDDPVFSHGQTYVALSRTRRAADIHIYSHVDTDEIDNVVYGRVTEFLRDLDKIYENQKSKYPQKPAGK